MRSNHPPLTRTVLVVDDEPALRSFAGVILRELGYSATLAENGRAAVQRLLQDPAAIDAVLLDMAMPGMRAEETFRLLTEINPGLPVIVLSGEPESAVRERFGSAMIAGYIQKPYTEIELEAALAQALARPSPPTASQFQLARLSARELEEAKREYLAARRLEWPRIAALLAARDFDALQAIGHNLKGSGGCFGLPELSLIGKDLERYAQSSDAISCKEQLNALGKALQRENSGPSNTT